MKRIRAAFLLPSMAGGGAERVALEVLGHLPPDDYDLTLALLRREGPYLEQIPPHVRVVEVGGAVGVRELLPTAVRLERLWRRLEPDLVLAFQTELNTTVLTWALLHPLRRRRLLISEHNNLLAKLDHETSALRRHAKLGLLRFLYPKAAGAVAVSRGVADILEQHCGLAAERITVIHNPVDLEAIDRNSAEAPEIDLPDDDRFTVVAAGRFIHQKGFDVLLDAFATLRRERPCRLILLGEGPLRADLEARVAQLGMTADVRMPGFQRNPWAVFARSDAFVLSSRWEGFGNVIVEAMACGVPVVATDCPHGPAEILGNGRYGTLVAVEDAVELAAALRALANDAPRRAQLRSAGRQRARAFDSRTIAAHYDALLKETLARAEGAR